MTIVDVYCAVKSISRRFCPVKEAWIANGEAPQDHRSHCMNARQKSCRAFRIIARPIKS